MRPRTLIYVVAGIAAALIVALVAAGCGEGDKLTGTGTPATQIQCEPNAPSRIPAPKGKPIFVDFFRDT